MKVNLIWQLCYSINVDLPDSEIDVNLSPVNPEDADLPDIYLPEMLEAQ